MIKNYPKYVVLLLSAFLMLNTGIVYAQGTAAPKSVVREDGKNAARLPGLAGQGELSDADVAARVKKENDKVKATEEQIKKNKEAVTKAEKEQKASTEAFNTAKSKLDAATKAAEAEKKANDAKVGAASKSVEENQTALNEAKSKDEANAATIKKTEEDLKNIIVKGESVDGEYEAAKNRVAAAKENKKKSEAAIKEAQAKVDSAEENLEKVQNSVKGETAATKTKLDTAQKEFNSAKKNKSSKDEAVKSAKEGVTKSEKDLKDAQAGAQYEKTLQSTTNLINSAKKQGEEIKKDLEKCGECENKKLLELRVEANNKYVDFLKEQQKLKLCELHPECKKNAEEIKRLKDLVTKTSDAVKAEVRKITQFETDREKVRTFEVSDIFSTSGDEEKRSVRDVVNTIANWMITLVASLAVTTLIIGGFLMIISGGDESRLETGKTIFTYSLIGIIVTLMAFGIISFIQSIFYA